MICYLPIVSFAYLIMTFSCIPGKGILQARGGEAERLEEERQRG
jgi:hypothetical protein